MSETDCSLIDLLALQLTEVDMLISMYPSRDEFKLDDLSVIDEIKSFIDGKTDTLPPRMDFTLHLNIGEEKLEVSCSLPHDYPSSEPEIYARSNCLTRDNQHQLNEDISNFLSEQPKGELCIGSLIQWLLDNTCKYITEKSKFCNTLPSSEDSEDDEYFCRLWIYSHHIYNKCKRRSILELSQQLQLTGFCLPGKPGIICVEGPTKDCNYFWHKIKHMNWKKIILKKKEILELDSKNNLRKFGTFEEISFQPRKGPGREYHMDMGEFFHFLEEHHCGYVFRDYFGIDGRLSGHS
ncbi:RWD domain-containing protein 2A [Centruroides vittatus]|uniref:RWD domain-containing protein 2A n=1 Tax=Centruroides vittatus TaxID=120091 RepID=UPI00350F89FD